MDKKPYKSARELPIYTACYKLLFQVDSLIKHLSRDVKHTLGQNIYNTTLDLLECIRIANDFPEERIKALLTFLGKFDNIVTMLKLANEKKYIPTDIYLALSKPISSIDRQANGWLKSSIEAGVSSDPSDAE